MSAPSAMRTRRRSGAGARGRSSSPRPVSPTAGLGLSPRGFGLSPRGFGLSPGRDGTPRRRGRGLGLSRPKGLGLSLQNRGCVCGFGQARGRGSKRPGGPCGIRRAGVSSRCMRRRVVCTCVSSAHVGPIIVPTVCAILSAALVQTRGVYVEHRVRSMYV